MYWPAPGYGIRTRGVDGTGGASRPGARRAGRLLEATGAHAVLFALTAASLFGVGLLREHLRGGGFCCLLSSGSDTSRRGYRFVGDDRWRYWSWGNVWTYLERLPQLGPAAAVCGALTVGRYGAVLFLEALPWVAFADPVVALVV